MDAGTIDIGLTAVATFLLLGTSYGAVLLHLDRSRSSKEDRTRAVLPARITVCGLDGLDRRHWRTARRACLASCALAIGSIVSGCASRPAGPVPVGAWMLDGDLVVTTASGTDGLRYRNLRTGESQQLVPDPRSEISDTAGAWSTGPGWGADPDQPPLRLELKGGGLVWLDGHEARRASRIAVREIPLTVQSGNVTLSGRLLLPICDGLHAAVVIVHGSGRESAVSTYAQPWAFAANGIATLVFDKRGTGASGGDFTMDFSVLADDVVQAVHALRESGHVDPNRIGLAGYSQGGWVAPLAASRTNVAFLLVAYGMIDSPASEDRLETLESLRRRGFSEDDLTRADEVISAVHAIIESDFREGWSELGSLKRRYQAEPWMREMGGFSGPFVRFPRWILTTFGKRRMPPGLPLHHDSYEILEQLDVPMLWLVAGADREAPPGETIAWLEANPRTSIEWTVYPDADHGMLEFVERDGQRIYTRVVPAFYIDQTNWVREAIGATCHSFL
jgi:uncharacterized protein